MAENVRSPGPVTRFYRRLAGYFRAVIDPALSMRARIFSSAKGLAAVRRAWPGAVIRVRRHFDSVHAEYFQSTKSQNRPAQRADLVRWQAPRHF